MALELLDSDVRLLGARMLTLPTPCDGWTVRDLINHMNAEHAAICDGAVTDDSDPRAEFGRIAARWVAFFESTMGRAVRVPKMGADIPSEIVLSVHLADMVVHRWDLTSAIGSPCPVPEELLDAAAEVAEVATANGGPLVGPDGVYKPALEPDPKGTRLENLVANTGEITDGGDNGQGAASGVAMSHVSGVRGHGPGRKFPDRLSRRAAWGTVEIRPIWEFD